jgi:CrcB protein
MRTVVAVGVAGFAGAVARYGIEGFVSERAGGAFPWGTLIVNISGSFVLGVLFAVLIEGRVLTPGWLRTSLTVGLVGAYTTFSTFTLETVRLIEERSYLLAATNAQGSLLVGLLAAYAGIVVGRLV